MIDLAKKLEVVHANLRERKGQFVLFAMFMPSDSELWDVVVAARWLNNDLASYELITSSLKSHLSQIDLQQIGRIVILEENEESVSKLVKRLPPNASVGMVNFDFGGTRVRRAQIIHAAGKAKRVS